MSWTLRQADIPYWKRVGAWEGILLGEISRMENDNWICKIHNDHFGERLFGLYGVFIGQLS